MTRRPVSRRWLAVALLASATARVSAGAQTRRQSPLPRPRGEYAVGRTQFDWTDESRVDAESPTGHREIVVWVWYPAASRSSADAVEWMPGKWGELFWADYTAGHPNVR